MAEDLGDKFMDKTSGAREKIMDVSEDVGEKVLDVSEKVGGKVMDVAEDVGEKVLEKGSELWERAKEAGSSIMDKADGLVQKAEVKVSVVAYQNRARTAVFANRAPDLTERTLQRIALVDSGPQWMVRVDAVDCERRGFKIGTFKRFDVIANRLASRQEAVGIDFEQHGGNLEQSICFRIESARLDVDHHGQKTAKAVRHSYFI